MVLVSYSGREINAKLVYYGPGLSGKTTNLEYIYGSIPHGQRGKMVSMKTKTERTLFFDFLPVHLGELSGFKTRFLLYTVPGQVYYNATRKLVLKGVDAVVFVADSKRGKMDENVESLENLRENLREHGLSLDQIPWVIQYNKRDLSDTYSVAELEGVLNAAGVPSFEAVATTGEGVVETFKGVSRLLLKKLAKEIGVSVVAGETPQVAPETAARVPAEHMAPAEFGAPTSPVPLVSAASASPAASPTASPTTAAMASAPPPASPMWDGSVRFTPRAPSPEPAAFPRVAPHSSAAAERETPEPAAFPRLEDLPPLTADSAGRTTRVAPEPESTQSLPPPAERIDAQAFLRDTTESVAEKEERPTSVGERLRRWLSRNQEREVPQEDSTCAPEPHREETPAAAEGASRETSRFIWEESVPVVPDLSVRSGPSAILHPETQPAMQDASAAVESRVTVTRDEETPLAHAAGLSREIEWELPADEGMPEAPPPMPEAAPPAPMPEATTPTSMPEATAPTPMPEATAPTPMPVQEVPGQALANSPAPRRVHPFARSGAPRPREVIVPIEIHPEDLERGITLKLAIQAPWWQERDEDEEAREAA